MGQGYESTEGQQDYKTSIGMIYEGQEQPIDIGKSNNNFKDRKPKCFNCNRYGHIAKECWKKEEKETRKCFKCDRKEHITKDYKEGRLMKKQKVQEESNEEDKEKETKKQDFGDNLK